MAIIAAVKDFDVARRSDFPLTLTFRDGNRDLINLTGYTVIAQCWDEGRNIKYGDFAITYTNRATGTKSAITPTPFNTSKLPIAFNPSAKLFNLPKASKNLFSYIFITSGSPFIYP